jgi:DNA-dependent RNA polymerase auxiliary subunit epsilon
MKTYKLSWREDGKKNKTSAHYISKKKAEEAREDLTKRCYDITIEQSYL